ncbi:hypothetical protein EPR50_G00182910 [Perca flavescens]|uniref:BEN domain-containing protein n=2 Tax=Perca flavescens TaxID=8167 RepID=A0A484CCB2_PERFV|nr:hypothetical protein EPR50_G00182910 [Perca flavescens]
MWQTLGQVNSHRSVSTATGRSVSYAAYLHQHHTAANQDADFSPQVLVQRLQDELSADTSESWEDGGAPDHTGQGAPGHTGQGAPGHTGQGAPGHTGQEALGHTGQEAPLCSQTDMEELRRSCSESQCTANAHGLANRQVEVYPGSGVLCDFRSWQAANQAPSPTAMARLLLLGVFDMHTLMNSNLRGGRSRRPAFHPQRNALDPHKINTIFNAILARFPLAKRGVIGSGINSKLSEIRFHSRRANRDAPFL